MSNLSKPSKSSGGKIPTSVTLRDGSIAKVNDFVYLDSISQGDFYQIARIVQFLPSTKRDIKAEVAHFYRRCNTGIDWSPKDDPQLLYITLSTEDVHACHMVGKCTVTHLSLIHDLEEYRRLENHFFFSQFFEKFQGHIFDVVPTSHIYNLPQDVIPKIQNLFSFVFGEKSEIRKLKDTRKDCVICHNWCGNASSSAVSCIICEEYYHKQCAIPPITANFTKGFVFQCAPCLQKAKVDFNDPSQTYVNSRSGGKTSLVQFRTKNQTNHQSEGSSNLCYTPIELVCTQNHPIRYLGKNVSFEQALDPFASLHVKFLVSIGKDHQIEIPPYLGSSTHRGSNGIGSLVDPSQDSFTGNIKCLTTLQYGIIPPASKLIKDKESKEEIKQSKSEPEPEVNLESNEDHWHCDSSSNTLFRPKDNQQEVMAKKLWKVIQREEFAVPAYTLQLGIQAYSDMMKFNFDETKTLHSLKSLKASDFKYFDVLVDDKKFEAALLQHGLDFDLLSQEFPPMSPRDAIQRFYTWKAEIVRQKERHGPNFAPRDNKLMAMVYPDDHHYQNEEEEPTVEGTSNSTRRRRQTAQVIKSCAHCRSRDEPKWQSVPTFVTQQPALLSIYCIPCASYLFRYAVPRPLIEPSINPTGRKNLPRTTNRLGLDELPDKKSDEVSRREKSHLNRKTILKSETTSRSSTVKPSTSYRSSLTSSPLNTYLSDSVSTTSSHPSEAGTTIKRPSDAQMDLSKSSRLRLEPSPKIMLNGVPSCRSCYGTSSIDLIFCTSCGFSVHSGCYPGFNNDFPWYCDWCVNQTVTMSAHDPTCSACLKVHSDSICLKKTVGNHWVHLSCLTFISPLWFNAENRIAGLSDSLDASWSKPCSLCPQTKGLTVQCSSCIKVVHIPCAQANNFWLGLELRENQTLAPAVFCSDHITHKDHRHIELYDIDINVTSTSDSDTHSNPSRLAQFLKTDKFKSSQSSLSVISNPLSALGSLARTMNLPLIGKSFWNCLPAAPLPCYECQSQFSPFWWNIFPDSKASAEAGLTSGVEISFHRPGHQHRICHPCYWKLQATMGAHVSPLETSETSP